MTEFKVGDKVRLNQYAVKTVLAEIDTTKAQEGGVYTVDEVGPYWAHLAEIRETWNFRWLEMADVKPLPGMRVRLTCGSTVIEGVVKDSTYSNDNYVMLEDSEVSLTRSKYTVEILDRPLPEEGRVIKFWRPTRPDTVFVGVRQDGWIRGVKLSGDEGTGSSYYTETTFAEARVGWEYVGG